MTTRLSILTLSIVLFACGTTKPASPPSSNAVTTAVLHEALPFIHDDFPKALAEAKRQNKPLFVDAWAPWCHSCQSLRAHVLTDPTLTPLAPSFVWLSVDTEKDENARWVERYPHAALPTLWIIDPRTERAVLKWAGTATAAELRDLLTVATAETASGTKTPDVEATAAFVRGNHALATGDSDTAVKEYRAALAAASKQHPHRARMAEALVTELSLEKDLAACAEAAAAEAAGLPVGTSRTSVLVVGLGCARSAKRDAEKSVLLAMAAAAASARNDGLLADDRSALYEEVVETLSEHESSHGQKVAEEWALFLEDEAAHAKTNDARAALDPLRLNAYLALNEPARAIPMLDRSEKDFPSDYNPPARLGRVYLEMKRLDDADKAADRAVARVYGPRAMRVFALKADIAKARGDHAGEIKALDEALARSERAVLTEGQKGIREGLVKRRLSLR